MKVVTRILGVAILTGALVAAVPAQSQSHKGLAQKCELTLDQSPVIRGLKLGQSHAYRTANLRFQYDGLILSDVDRRQKETGIVEERISPEILESSVTMRGIQSVSLTYLDDKLISIVVLYDDSATWKNNIQFTDSVARSLDLPTKGWIGAGPSVLLCNGFSVTTGSHHRAGLMVTRSNAAEDVKARIEQVEEAKRRAFKP
jgi:hypothetical protein